ncbi:transposase [Streptomyces hirsutus]
MTSHQETVAEEATTAEQAWAGSFGAVTDSIAGCFRRREARGATAESTAGLLLEVDTKNCWPPAEAWGHPGPHRLQHLLSRAAFDHDTAKEQAAALVVQHLGGEETVLVVDETGDAKSSTGAVGASAPYSGALGGVGLRQSAVHLAVVTATTRVIIDRSLYVPRDRAADEERRDAAGVPADIMFAPKPQQAAAMLEQALDLGGTRAGLPRTRSTGVVNCAPAYGLWGWDTQSR